MINSIENLRSVKEVHEIILKAKKFFYRKNNEITLIIVSKNLSLKETKKIINQGQKNFGENYVQEGIKKIFFFRKSKNLIWHFIGKIQSNKTKIIAENFDWCHTIDRIKIAKRLNFQRPKNKTPLNVLIQIQTESLDLEVEIFLKNLKKLVKKILTFQKLKFRGFMMMQKKEFSLEKKILNYIKIKNIFENFRKKNKKIDTLSIGTSKDFAIAIACGSNLLRIGSLLTKSN
ncbi:hypothetical protein AOQ88_00125 [Candidatus Riesia sp. GBBU]|nr:hypothetical protein AOQ88_00125 [Candidatus Riesia sp. GBBU]